MNGSLLSFRRAGQLVGLTVLLHTAAVSAAVLNVPADHPTIAAGLASAVAGDTVLVACGTYTEHDLNLVSGVTLLGEASDSACVVLDAQGSGRGFLGTGLAAGTQLVGIEVTNGLAPYGLIFYKQGSPGFEVTLSASGSDPFVHTSAATGGPRNVFLWLTCAEAGASGVEASVTGTLPVTGFLPAPGVTNSGSATELLLTFSGCPQNRLLGTLAVTDTGGEICLAPSTTGGVLAGIDCNGQVSEPIHVTGFTSSGTPPCVSQGGGCTPATPPSGQFGGAALYLEASDIEIRDCVFRNGDASHGGAIHQEGGKVTLDRCRFESNRGTYGGAVYAGPTSSLAVVDCRFEGNSGGRGGCFYLARATFFAATRSVFRENVSWAGAAAEAHFSPASFTDCSFWNNQATYRSGGALACFDADVAITGCTFAYNHASAGSALFLHAAHAALDASVLAFNYGSDPVEVGPGGSVSTRCTDVFGHVNGNWVGPLAGQDLGSGNLEADPEFCTWFGGLLEPSSLSPLVAANNSCGIRLGALDAGPCSGTVPVAFDTDPTGLPVTLDGRPVPTPLLADAVVGDSVEAFVVTTHLLTPDEKLTFASWSDGGSQRHDIVFPSSPTTYTAAYTRQFRIVVTYDPGGTAPGTAFHPEGSVISLTATPYAGYMFDGWTGTGTGSYTGPNPTPTVTMLGPITEHAAFSLTSHTLTMIAGPGGTVSPATGPFPEGTTVAIQAVPDSAHLFGGWVGAGPGSYTGPNAGASVVMSGDITETAAFNPLPTHHVTIQAVGSGMVAPPTGDYAEGVSLVLQATPDPGSRFTGWTGTGPGSYTGTLASTTIQVQQGDITQTATFEAIPIYTLTMTPGSGGTVNPPSGSFPESTLVLLSATPGAGFKFGGWTGTGPGSYTGLQNPVSVQMLGDITQTASFPVIPVYTVTVAAGLGGTVTPATGTYPEGSYVLLRATPDSGYLFAGWVGTGPGSYTGLHPTPAIVVAGDISETGSFAAIQDYTLTMNSASGGSVSPSSGTYSAGTVVPIFAYPDTGWVFGGWTGTGLGSFTGPQPGGVSVQMFSDITQTPTFVFPATHRLQVQAGAGGTVTPPSGDFANGSTVQITAVPDSGFLFTAWVGAGIGSYTGTANPATVTMGGPISQTASFTGLTTVTVTTVPAGKRVAVDGVDQVSPYTFETVVGANHGLILDAISPSQFPGTRDVFVAWEDGSTRTTRGISAPSTPAVYTGTYAPQYLLDFQDPPQIVSSPGPGYYDAGTVVSIQATALPSYVFDQWIGSGPGSYTGSNNPATITMDGPIVQTPTVHQLGYELSISASDVDPFVNTDAPGGSGRLLYLWLACSEDGISALDAEVSGTLTAIGFNGANGVLNAGAFPRLLLAIPGCPGATAPFLIGSIQVNDTGGDVCLAPSSVSGVLGAVDCVSFGVTDPVQVTGFSSSGGGPCFVPGVSCLSGIPASAVVATAVERTVAVGWDPAAEPDLAYHVYRGRASEGPYVRITEQPLRGAGEFRDRSVDGRTTYHYRVAAVRGRSETVLGGTEITTPEWAPLVDAYLGAHPNPFRADTELRLTVARTAPVRVSIYDVAGRLVKRVADEALDPGEYAISWDGRNSQGKIVPAGVYFSQVKIGAFTASRKIVRVGGR